MMMISALVLCWASLPLLASPRVVPSRRVPAGDWGGQHAMLKVQRTGATLELDCAHGTIDGALHLDRAGRFQAKGRYQWERGPLIPEETGRPARYSGSLKGPALTLSIVTEDGQTEGPFHLERGRPAHLVKCQ